MVDAVVAVLPSPSRRQADGTDAGAGESQWMVVDVGVRTAEEPADTRVPAMDMREKRNEQVP